MHIYTHTHTHTPGAGATRRVRVPWYARRTASAVDLAEHALLRVVDPYSRPVVDPRFSA